MTKESKQKTIITVGRRKAAIARAILRTGKGKIRINSRELEEYFSKEGFWLSQVKEPLERTSLQDSFDFEIKVYGGGLTGQAGAIKLAIARALEKQDPTLRAVLKSAGCLKRDPREVERKKYFLRKARKSTQYSKR